MTKEERLKLMARGYPNGYIPKHCKLACWVLYDLERLLTGRGIAVYNDPYWPYHILVKAKNGNYVSLFCKGFTKAVEIQKLRKDGMADLRHKEVSFSTALGAANYILRRIT